MTKRILFALWPLVPISLYVAWVMLLDQAGLLPRPLATHWGATGSPDGFAGLEGHFIGAGFGFAIPSLIWAVAAPSTKLHQSIRRLLLVLAVGIFVVVFVLMVYFVAIQIGVSNPRDVAVGGGFYFVFLPLLLGIAYLIMGRAKISAGKNLKIKLRGITFLTLEFSEIESVSEAKISWKDFGGLGLRFAKNKVAFIPSSGRALCIKTRSGQEVFIRTNNVDLAISLIAAKI